MNVFREEVEVTPAGALDVLSQLEVSKLTEAGRGGLGDLFRRCALAVLNCGGMMDDARLIFQRFRDFEIEVVQQERGVRLRMRNAPAEAFVDGRLIRGIREHLFAVLRDVVYVNTELVRYLDMEAPAAVSDAVFHILRNADALRPGEDPNLVVCWGGHSISREEYDYSKSVGYEMGLRGLDVCTGCGPGAMKGPMKGAAVGHAKQRNANGRYLGISEPGIIAAEAPNPICNELVVMPDMEKRLEAFLRIGHGVVVFPGGVGTAEELLFLLGVLSHPDNADMPLPVVLTGPAAARNYFGQLDAFIRGSLGERVAGLYEIVLDDPPEVARRVRAGTDTVRRFRRSTGDAYYFNWRLALDPEFQSPFEVTHQSMAALDLRRGLPLHRLAANLRRAFSGIVTGNVKDYGIRAIEAHGPFEIRGDEAVTDPLDGLLRAFVEQGRMRLPGIDYVPCYRVLR